jgi:hypothetical protein
MTHMRPPEHRRPLRRLGRKRYAIVWLAGTVSAVVVSYAGIRASDVNASNGDPVVRPAPPPSTVTIPAPSPAPASPATPSPTPSPERPRRTRTPAFQGVRITSPDDDAKVNGSVGVVLKGRYGDLRGAELRVFVLAFNGQYYLNDNGPVLSSDGTWDFLVKPIGAGTSDIGRVFTIIVATVDSACRATLQASNRAPDGNIAFPALPAGCRAADKVNVLKTAF